ncbi:nucleotidyltransferase domain-containing protein [Patescibacteria group bacterium]|nr:nucleotidyltransferase domain-containing protein [Patescibacteria group bacterium]MBU4000065.1 nucleotidyltransferase domain-containing protein [Patescibacteria group bacterium]MBU4057244.1 nucleotidyltransferase domain-containing protein [Patescibacteria group bacterium]MBU4368901.1 nucleotidyltransferase domain-containing protein [Patescibacteria group bacterium]
MKQVNKQEKLEKIAQKYGLELILLFGSRAEKKFLHRESDFDIAYLAKRNFDLGEELRLAGDMASVFKSENIDLVNLKIAGPLLAHQIFKNHKILFYRNLITYHIYRIYAERKYEEANPLFKLQKELIKNFLSKHKKYA